jgi:hypothetical protein
MKIKDISVKIVVAILSLATVAAGIKYEAQRR